LDEAPAVDSDQTAPLAAIMTTTEIPGVSVPGTATSARLDRVQLLDHVVRLLAALLDLPTSDIDHDEGFFQLGLDSLLAVELRRQLESTVGIDLPGTLLFEQPNAIALVDWLTDALNVLATPAPVVAAAPPVHESGPPQRFRPDVTDGNLEDLVALLDAEIDRSRTTRERVMK
jgi:acyl carrier protein